MKVREVLSYSYIRSDSKKVFKKIDLNYYLNHGYSIVRDFGDENFWVINKPAKVYARVLTEDDQEVMVECKETIVSYYEGTNISKKRIEDFFDGVKLGIIELELDYWKELIAFTRTNK